MKTPQQYIHHYRTEDESTEFTHKHWKALMKFLNKKRNRTNKKGEKLKLTRISPIKKGNWIDLEFIAVLKKLGNNKK